MFTMLTPLAAVKTRTAARSPGPEEGAVPTTTRRARQRDATLAEIRATARALLVDSGPEALTLRATARDMGMTAPALYRYVASHEDLVTAVCEDVLDEVTRSLEQ